MKRNLLIVLSFTAVLAAALMIFGFSAQPAAASDGLSLRVTQRLLALFSAEYRGMGAQGQLAWARRINGTVRKLAHLLEYTLFGALLAAFFRTAFRERRGSVTAAVILGVLYAAGDELHQGFVAGRGPGLRDVLIDSGGILLGVVLALGLTRLLARVKLPVYRGKHFRD